MKELKVSFVDLYLIHWPQCYDEIEWMDCGSAKGNWRSSWRALEKLFAEGALQAIGVSNFDSNLLKQMMDTTLVVPHVVQNYMDPFSIDFEMLALAKEAGIQFQVLVICVVSPPPFRANIWFQAYSSARSLASEAKKDGNQVKDEWTRRYQLAWAALQNLAEDVKLRVSSDDHVGPVEVLVQWVLGLGGIAIPATSNPAHASSNLRVTSWELTREETDALTSRFQQLRQLPVDQLFAEHADQLLKTEL